VAIVAWHHLIPADRAPASAAEIALAAWQHRGHDHRTAEERWVNAVSDIAHSATDLVAKYEGKCGPRLHAIEEESDVRVTHAAACHLDNSFAGLRFPACQWAPLEPRAGRSH
jgi:hypothetical protein